MNDTPWIPDTKAQRRRKQLGKEYELLQLSLALNIQLLERARLSPRDDGELALMDLLLFKLDTISYAVPIDRARFNELREAIPVALRPRIRR